MALANVSKLVKQDEFGRLMAPYATNWQESKGRKYEETKASDRSPFQRDRDRIIHSDAFRRLQYKTQVFTNTEEGDFRTRLTHSLEVAQLSRSICRALGLDEDLGEVVALAHDLGHPPFGHAGEEALHECMKDYGGFYHNLQTIKLVREIECRYGGFDGLNLSWESLEGIAKHNGPMEEWEADDPLVQDLDPAKWCGLEGQVAAACDDLAYNHHDIDDGLRTKTFHFEEIYQLPQFARCWEETEGVYPNIEWHRKVKETIRRMINRQVKDLLHNSTMLINKYNPQTVQDVRDLDRPLIDYSDQVKEENRKLKAFLMQKMYKHYKKNRMDFRAHKVVKELFHAFMHHKRLLPDDVRNKILEKDGDTPHKARIVCDYIACLTDRSALTEHEKLYGVSNHF